MTEDLIPNQYDIERLVMDVGEQFWDYCTEIIDSDVKDRVADMLTYRIQRLVRDRVMHHVCMVAEQKIGMV